MKTGLEWVELCQGGSSQDNRAAGTEVLSHSGDLFDTIVQTWVIITKGRLGF